MDLVAIDPGVKACGIAYMHGKELLVGHVDLAQAIYQVGLNCGLIVELPRIYRAAKSPGDPEDLLQLARVVGRLEQATRGPVRIVRPNEWKGSVSKDMHNARILHCAEFTLPGQWPNLQRQLAQLPKSRAHNAIDALGLYLFGKGLMTRRGTPSDTLSA